MNKAALIAITITALITAVITSVALKALGVPKGDLHPMITAGVSTVASMLVGQRYWRTDES